MAKPYREGKGWAVRVRCKGQDLYLKGFETEADARQAAEAQRVSIHETGKPAGTGPQRTSLAQAFQRYGQERLPTLKGARQDAQRINRYLRAANLQVLVLEPVKSKSGARYWNVALAQEPATRPVPNSLKAHRRAQSEQDRECARLRARLAGTPVAELTSNQLQGYLDALVEAGYEAATIALERAELRRLFNYARNVWSWRQPSYNPASGLKLPQINNGRDRVISNDEWQRLVLELEHYGNKFALPGLVLLLETTMRSSEPLLRARWRDLDWVRCVLKLTDAKAGQREVPLSPAAMTALKMLQGKLERVDPDANILPTTYEALKKAWKVACQKAGVDAANIHDLRHTGTTRYAIEYNGNIPVLQQITGHKTVQMLMRYVHIRADDVVRLMHGRAQEEGAAPAGLRLSRPEAVPEPPRHPAQPAPAEWPTNVVRFPTERRAA